MINTRKLRGLMVERGVTVETVANKLGQNRSTFYRKLRNPDTITVSEACKLKDILSLDSCELHDIFFT